MVVGVDLLIVNGCLCYVVVDVDVAAALLVANQELVRPRQRSNASITSPMLQARRVASRLRY